MQQLSLRRSVMLFLVMMLFAWQSQGLADWDEGNVYNVQARDGCSTSRGEMGGVSSAVLTELPADKNIINLYYPVTSVNENSQMAGPGSLGSTAIPPLIFKPADNIVLEQILTKSTIFCQLSGNQTGMGKHPYLHINPINNKRLNNALKKKGLKMQYRLPTDGIWHDIDDSAGTPLPLSDLNYSDFVNLRLTVPSFPPLYKRMNYTAIGYYSQPFELGLRLWVVDSTMVKGSMDDINTGIPLGDLFYVTPAQTLGTAPKVTIRSVGNLKFAIARCSPRVDVPSEVNFGTLTTYKLNQPGEVADRPFRVTVTKDDSCDGGFQGIANYAVPKIQVMFTPSSIINARLGKANLMNSENNAFQGLSFSIFRQESKTTALPFTSPVSLALNLNSSFISVDDKTIHRDFIVRIEKDTLKNEKIATGRFHASVTVQVIFN